MKKTPKKAPQKTDLRALIRKRYDENAWALFEEVRNAAGHKATRSADAVAMSLWPSRGLHIHGFELKSSRSDWLNELKAPEKSEPVMRYCDFWWLIADKGIANESEIPKTWGYMVPHGSGLKVVKDAPKLEPKPLDCSFVAVLLKAAQAEARRPEAKIRDEISSRLRKEFDAEIDNLVRRKHDHKVWGLENRVRRLEEELKFLRDAEGKVGKPIQQWELDRYARALLALDDISSRDGLTLEYVVRNLASALESVKAADDMIQAMRKKDAAE